MFTLPKSKRQTCSDSLRTRSLASTRSNRPSLFLLFRAVQLVVFSIASSDPCYPPPSKNPPPPRTRREMADWGPVLIGVVLFVLLQPGLLFQLPGHHRHLDFGGMKTNGKSIAVHTLIFFALYAILILAVHVHIFAG